MSVRYFAEIGEPKQRKQAEHAAPEGNNILFSDAHAQMERIKPFVGKHVKSKPSASDDMFDRIFTVLLNEVKSDLGQQDRVDGWIEIIIAYYQWTNDREKSPAHYGKPTDDPIEEARRQCKMIKPYLARQMQLPPQNDLYKAFESIFISMITNTIGTIKMRSHPDRNHFGYVDILIGYVLWHARFNEKHYDHNGDVEEEPTEAEKLRRETEAVVYEMFKLRRERDGLVAKNIRAMALNEALSQGIPAKATSETQYRVEDLEGYDGREIHVTAMVEELTLDSGHDEATLVSKANELIREREALIRERDAATSRANDLQRERDELFDACADLGRRNEEVMKTASKTEALAKQASSSAPIFQCRANASFTQAEALKFERDSAVFQITDLIYERDAARSKAAALEREKEFISRTVEELAAEKDALKRERNELRKEREAHKKDEVITIEHDTAKNSYAGTLQKPNTPRKDPADAETDAAKKRKCPRSEEETQQFKRALSNFIQEKIKARPDSTTFVSAAEIKHRFEMLHGGGAVPSDIVFFKELKLQLCARFSDTISYQRYQSTWGYRGLYLAIS